MDRKKAAKLADEILGENCCLDHRNVWVFISMSEQPDLIITKDEAPVKRPGIYRCNHVTGAITDADTNEKVPMDEVFGIPFYRNRPELFDDRFLADISDEERINELIAVAEALIDRLGMPVACKIMLGDLADSEDNNAEARLVVLCNYLARQREPISVTDFAYIHHELFSM